MKTEFQKKERKKKQGKTRENCLHDRSKFTV